mgnify:CR=1 FL=1
MISPSYSKLIQWLLHSLGATENYNGFFPAVYAVQLSIGDPERLRLITKLIYPDVAAHCGTNWKAVERNIRTLVSVAWENDPLMLSELAGFPLKRKPTNAQFLAILTDFCTRIIL